ncbi:MAG: threonine synthase [SAR324 cluster bacterium]|nr:threonine synthase [SAR324 cluster bacterium]
MVAMNFVKRLYCAMCGKTHEAGKLWNLCTACEKPLLLEYDLEQVKQALSKDMLKERVPSMWRYRELLPVAKEENIVTLGEGLTPVLPLERAGKMLGMSSLLVKDEGQMPTLSFKCRGLSMAVSMARELGVKRLAIPSAGNAGGAMAAYGARAGMEVYVFMPEDVPDGNIIECDLLGASYYLVNGLINDCGAVVKGGTEEMGWFDVSTLKEPYRIEGKKTMGLEVAEQFGWELPDVIIYPTGGGTGLIGMWKAFEELEAMGWIGSKRPRMVSVQSSGCAPIVKAFKDGAEHAEFWENARTIAPGMRVPSAVGDFLMLRALRESGGEAVAVDDEALLADQKLLAASEGIFPCPEGAATYTALRQLLKDGKVDAGEKVLLFNTGNAMKYPYTFSAPHLKKEAVDYAAMAAAP